MRGFLTLVWLSVLVAVSAYGQYKMEPGGAPPADAGPFAQLLQKQGFRIASSSGPWAEIWFRSSLPTGPKTNEENVSLVTVPHGAFLGVIHFIAPGADRRGQPIKPGFYSLRFSLFPVNGDHQGVAPQRDFLVVTPLAEDKDPNSTPNFETLMNMGRKASGTPHPAVLSVWKADTDFAAGFAKQGENDWVLQTKIGDTPIALILVGKAEG